MSVEFEHGGSGGGYTNHGCRCDACKQANTVRYARRRKEREQEAKNMDDPRHGTPSFYANWGCRCERCRAASRAKRTTPQEKTDGSTEADAG